MHLYSFYGVDDNDNEELRVARRKFHSDRELDLSSNEVEISEEVKTKSEIHDISHRDISCKEITYEEI